MSADSPSDEVVVECDLPDPPEKVWRALTTPALVAAWLAPNAVTAEPGAQFRIETPAEVGGDIDCQVLEAETARRLSVSWREARPTTDPALDSVVTFELTRTADGGTHLRLVHGGLPAVPARQLPQLPLVRKPAAVPTVMSMQGDLKWAA